jgi:excisionase family DNA binding protein
MADKPRLYTPDEARTEYFGGKISRHNIYDAIRTGKLPHLVVGKRRILITEQALAAWLQSLTRAS